MITITPREFRQLADFIQTHYGVYLKEEKQTLINGRLQDILSKNDFKSFSEYYQYVIADRSGDALKYLLDRVTTHHTFFMRESDHFDFFRDKILPYYQHVLHDRDLRVWSAGCSTGEEPYTLAMIMYDFFGVDKALWDTRILATDLSSQVLDTAMKGIYKNDGLNALPVHWLLNYFKKINADRSEVSDQIKNEVVFRPFNLMEEIYPFRKKFHVIFCRNVMIYFDEETKRRLIRRFYEITEPGGYLIIGHSESLDRNQINYKYVIPAVYRKE
jgi:chemotaxis protein methyltransferase CheR